MVEKAIDGRDEQALRRREKVRGERPHGKLDGRAVQRRFGHVDDVGDAEQRNEHDGGPHRLAHLLDVAGVALAQLHHQHPDDVQQKGEVEQQHGQPGALQYPIDRGEIVAPPAPTVGRGGGGGWRFSFRIKNEIIGEKLLRVAKMMLVLAFT